MARIYKEGWLRAYDKYIVKQESPSIFHFWVSCAIVGAAMRRNVYIDRGAYKVFPNNYIFLIAKSGGCKKSAAMDLGMNFIHQLKDAHVICGKMTTEGLTDEMDRATIDPMGVVKPDGSILIQADELSYLFGKSAYVTDLVTFLTAAYTGKARLDFLTRGRGLVQVRNPCPSILAGSTPEQLGEIFPSMTLASGFMARVLLIYAERGSRVPKPIIDHDMEDGLVKDLHEIGRLCGEMVLDDDADEMFDDWYMSLENINVSKDIETFYERKHDHVLKTAMILSAAESNEMRITKKHLEQALTAIDMIEADISNAVSYIGSTQQANTMDFMEGIIRSVYPESLSHSTLMRRIYKRLTYGAQEFREIMEFLIDQERVKEDVTSRGIFYTAIIRKGKKK